MVFALILAYECSNKIRTYAMFMWDKIVIFYLTVKDFNKQSYKNLYNCIFYELSITYVKLLVASFSFQYILTIV